MSEQNPPFRGPSEQPTLEVESPLGLMPTVEAPKAKPTQLDILEGLLRASQRDANNNFRDVRREIGETHRATEELRRDVGAIKSQVRELDERVGAASGRVRENVASDAEMAKQLALETQRRQKIETEMIEARLRMEAMSKEAEAAKAEATAAHEAADEAKTAATDTKALTVLQNEELAKQTALLNRLAEVAANPHVKDLVKTVIQAIVLWLALKFGLRP